MEAEELENLAATLISVKDAAKLFPGRNAQWVVRNIIEREKVDALKVNRAWYLKKPSLAKFIDSVTVRAKA